MKTKITDCIVRKTIPGSNHCAWGTSDSLNWPGPVYEHTFYLCKSKDEEQYYLFFTYDRFERGHWEATEDEGGMPITPQLAKVIAEDDTVTQDSIPLEGMLIELNEIGERLEARLSNSPFYPDLRNDLSELNACLEAGAYRAGLAMSGRILEICLKIRLHKVGVDIQDDWMIGKLLSLLKESNEYIDPGLVNVWNIINQQRIIGVHAKEKVPIPSKYQASMVAYAVLDVLDRTSC